MLYPALKQIVFYFFFSYISSCLKSNNFAVYKMFINGEIVMLCKKSFLQAKC